VLSDPTDPTTAADDDEGVSLVRSEERLVVGRETRAVERVRLRKHVVSEDVARTVTLRREELLVEHEPVADDGAAVDGHEPSTHEELEIVLHEERLEVVVVPVERVRVRVVRVEGERTVTEVLRREQIDLSQSPRP
jgi:uncharacterized protein (TIGR02271 family)